MLTSILGIVLIGTLYPLVAEAFGGKVSVGPPYFNPTAAVFALPMLAVMTVGPLLRWRRDALARLRWEMAIPALVALVIGLGLALFSAVHLLPLLGLALAPALALASLAPLRERNLKRTPLPVWGMVVAHVGIAVALFGMASDSAFTQERLVAAKVGDHVSVGPYAIELAAIVPVAGPNWTALQAVMRARYEGGDVVTLHPQARAFWAPPQPTTESALLTRWNGQLYAVLGDQADADGVERWQLRLWWKPFVPLIWLGGGLVALGGVLALLGRVLHDWRRHVASGLIAWRRKRQGR